MDSRLPVIDKDGEVGDLSGVASGLFRPAREVLSVGLQAKLRIKPRGPQKAPTKVATTIRLSPEVAQAFKASGRGWQTRLDAALKDWLRTHTVA